MQNKLATAIKIAIPVILAAVLLYYAFRNVEFATFWEKSKTTDFKFVLISIGISLIGYVLRAYRWNLLLKPLGFTVSTYRSSISVLIMYLANLAFPRLGEVTRCAVLKKTDNVPATISLGTVIAERIIDAFTLLALIGLSFVLEFEVISAFITGILIDYKIDSTKLWISFGVLLIIGVLVLAILFSSSNKFTLRLKDLLRGVYNGLGSIRKVQNVYGFVVSSILLWVVYYLMSYVIVFSLPETSFLDISAGFMLLVVGGIALALPVQGGIGTYHAMVTALLVMYGVDRTTGLFLATLLHTSQIVAIAIFGGVAVLLMLFLSRKKSNEPVETKNTDASGSKNSEEKVEI